MGNYDLSLMEAYDRFKTLRRRKRLLKKDKDKQLIQLSIRRQELFQKYWKLPLVPLKEPYQKGWVRSFVLREDIVASKDAEFFQNLLDKIDTEEYSHTKRFTVKKRRRGKKVWVPKPQFLKEISEYDWNCPKIGLTEKEKSFFYKKETVIRNWISISYCFEQPWRFVLKVKPNMITHTKMLDTDLEKEIKELENYITNNYIQPRMTKLTYGRKYAWKSYRKEKEKYRFNAYYND